MWIGVSVAGAGSSATYIDFPNIDQVSAGGNFAPRDVSFPTILIDQNVTDVLFRLSFEVCP